MTGATPAKSFRAAPSGDATAPTLPQADALPTDAGAPAYGTDADREEPGSGWGPPVVAILVALGCTGAMLALAWPSVRAGLPPVALVQLLAALCVPPTLVALLYLLAMRTSRAEAHRFGTTARAMRAEAAMLERVITMLARRIDENRAALAEQTNVLIAMGDRAAEHLEASARGIDSQSRAIDASTRLLADATTDAERRVEGLLSSLPQAQDAMRAMAARVEDAGLLASEHAAVLDVQLTALAARGIEADAIAAGAAERLAAHIARMEASSESAGARLEQVTGQMATEVDGAIDRTTLAVDEARRGFAAQGEAILAMLAANQAALDRAGRDSADAVAQRLVTIEEAVARVGDRLAQEQGRGDALFAGLSEGVERLDRDLQALHLAGTDRTQDLAASVRALHGSLEALSEAMIAGDTLARQVIGTSEHLLTALDASAREMDETLPGALARLDNRIAATREVVAGVRPELLALVTAAEGTHDAIGAIAALVVQQRDALTGTQASLLDTLATGGEQAEMLGQIVDETIAATRAFADSAAPQLAEALLRVRETATAAADHGRQALAGIVPGTVRALEDASGAALQRAMDNSIRHQLTELAETTEAAVHAAGRASERLTQQMQALADTTAQVEAQIQAGRAEREAADSESFARRVPLLIEALNSASIDIGKAFSAEVTDSAWSAYLKGDRGVFTRRAVRLLEPGETREIARLYGDDSDFRDNVNRYIHDFEAMLRHVLALRDGSPLSVTLLSSDMGKLYVALAQAIERLRS